MALPSLPCWAIIPATGIGSRMRADRPKQYLPLGSKSILAHTLDNLLSHPLVSGAVVVLHEQDDYWAQLDYRHAKTVLTCTGGEQRYHSVFNALQLLSEKMPGDAIVLIHDAVRPFVRHAELDQLMQAVHQSDDGAILAVPIADTLKLGGEDARIQATQARENLWRAFTPQVFRLQLIKQALQHVIQQDLQVTDDASAMELMGYRPRLVPGDGLNIKITHPADLELAQLILQLRKPAD